MRYNYECKKCKLEVTIVKPMSESSRVEKCPSCTLPMDRVFTSPSIGTSDGFKG